MSPQKRNRCQNGRKLISCNKNIDITKINSCLGFLNQTRVGEGGGLFAKPKTTVIQSGKCNYYKKFQQRRLFKNGLR